MKPVWVIISLIALVVLLALLTLLAPKRSDVPAERPPALTSGAGTPYPMPQSSLTAAPPSATPAWMATDPWPRVTVPVVASPTPGGPTLTPTPGLTPTTIPTTAPAASVVPFPTLALDPTPTGPPPEPLQRLWFVDYPGPGGPARLSAVLFDAAGNRWGQSPASIDMGLGRPRTSLITLDASADGRLLIAQTAYGEGPTQIIWIDPVSRTTQPIPRAALREGPLVVAWKLQGGKLFYTAGPSLDPALVALLGDNFLTLDIPEPDTRAYASSEMTPGRLSLFYSPTEDVVVETWHYPSLGPDSGAALEVALYDPGAGTRTVLARFPAGTYGGRGTVAWSPDGRRLAVTSSWEGPMSRTTSLWLVGRNGTGLRRLAAGVVPELVAWSPDGRYIALLKTEQDLGRVPLAGNLYVFDLDTQTVRAVTSLTDTEISALAWSPDGSRIAFALSREYYSEIWAVGVAGDRLVPLAGPAAFRAPFVWLP